MRLKATKVKASAAALLLAAAVVTGCGNGDDDVATPTATATATGAETTEGATDDAAETSPEVADDEAGLRGTLDAFYTDVAQQEQWDAAFGYLSERCQIQATPAEVAEAMEQQYSGEDVSALPDFEITIDGDDATVSAGAEQSIPREWSYVENRWAIDTCPEDPEEE